MSLNETTSDAEKVAVHVADPNDEQQQGHGEQQQDSQEQGDSQEEQDGSQESSQEQEAQDEKREKRPTFQQYKGEGIANTGDADDFLTEKDFREKNFARRGATVLNP